MRDRLETIAFSLLFAASAGIYMGCATMVMMEAASDNTGYTTKKRVLTDTIVALGKPDAALAKALGRDDCIAFIGEAHAYMLYEGGQALWGISQLKLDGTRMKTDGAESKAMFMQGDQVWGTLIVTYDGGKTLSPEQRSELIKGGFAADSASKGNQYHRSIAIKGLVLPSINSATMKIPELKRSHVIKFYANEQHYNPLATVAQVPFVVVGVAMDAVLLPVYIITIGGLAASGAL